MRLAYIAGWILTRLGLPLNMKLMVPVLLAVMSMPATAADDGALRQCRVLTDAAARLACYDALPLAAPSTVSATAPPLAAAAPAAAFGLLPPEEKVQEITSTIPGLFDGWGPRSLIRLANGQVWQVTDDSRGVYALRDPKVRVKRASLGSFVLDIEGANLLPRVRRVE